MSTPSFTGWRWIIVKHPLYASCVEDPDVASAAAAARAAIAAIRGRERGQAKFEAASALAEELRACGDEAADLRREAVQEIRDDAQVSLAALADRVGMSRARMSQLASGQKGKKKPRKDEPDA